MGFDIGQISGGIAALARPAELADRMTLPLVRGKHGPQSSPDARLSTVYGAIFGLIAGLVERRFERDGKARRGAGQLAKGVVVEGFKGWFVTVAAYHLRDICPSRAWLRVPVRAIQAIARFVCPGVGTAGMEATVGALLGLGQGLLLGGPWGRVGEALKKGVEQGFLWGVVQLCVQSTLDVAEYAGTSPGAGLIPEGYAEWQKARPPLDVWPRGEKLPADGKVPAEHDACWNTLSEAMQRRYERLCAQTQRAMAKAALVTEVPLDTSGRVYLVGRETAHPMPHANAGHVIDLNGESYQRFRMTVYERASEADLLLDLMRVRWEASSRNRIHTEGDAMVLSRGFSTYSSADAKSDADRAREAASLALESGTNDFLARHALLALDPEHDFGKGGKLSKAWFKIMAGVAEPARGALYRLLVQAKCQTGDFGAVRSRLAQLQLDAAAEGARRQLLEAMDALSPPAS